MDLPTTDVEIKPEKIQEVKEGPGPMFHCNLFDTEVVHKIAQAFLPGLASACVDNTTGGLFKSPASVAVDIRREMVEHLTQRSETFVAESVILEGGADSEVSDHPFDIISDFVDDFAGSKRNLFSRVSGWVLSERREDRIDDFVQEMEINGFWLMERRETVAQRLLKNVDLKSTFHCNMRFTYPEEFTEHSLQCGFRTMNCTNKGCTALFCAAQLENHDMICPFKTLQCEQKCSDSIMRREMDRHCITVCPMKLVNCPFYPVGCRSTVPRCTIEQHHLENLQSHMLYILQVIHKEASVEDLKDRAEELEKSSSPSQLAEAQDVRSLAFAIKDLEIKLGPLKINSKGKVHEEECAKSPTKTSPTKKDEYNESPTEEKDSEQSSSEEDKPSETPTKKEEDCNESPTMEKSFETLTKKEEEGNESPSRENAIQSSSEEDESSQIPTKKEEKCNESLKKEESKYSITRKEEYDESSTESETCTELPAKKE